MTKQLSAGPNTPQLTYELLHQTPLGPQRITASKEVTLLVPGTTDRQDALQIKVGDGVQTGQKISPLGPAGAYAISSVTGTIRPSSLILATSRSRRTSPSVTGLVAKSMNESLAVIRQRPLASLLRKIRF